MSSDGTFATVVAASMLLFLGMIVAFFGYRLFWIILPIWGFFFGLAIGAQGVQALFGDGFLSTGLSWVVAFFMGLLFAGLSYLFWFIAVALMGGYIGYGLVVGLFGLFSVELGPLVWILGVAAGVIFAVATLMLNLQKYVVIIGVGDARRGGDRRHDPHAVEPGRPVGHGRSSGQGRDRRRASAGRCCSSAIAVVGALFQLASTRYYEIERYNRWTEYTTVDGRRRRDVARPPILDAYHRGARATGLRGRHNAPATREPDPGNAGGGSRWFAPRSSFVREDPCALRCPRSIRARS